MNIDLKKTFILLTILIVILEITGFVLVFYSDKYLVLAKTLLFSALPLIPVFLILFFKKIINPLKYLSSGNIEKAENSQELKPLVNLIREYEENFSSAKTIIKEITEGNLNLEIENYKKSDLTESLFKMNDHMRHLASIEKERNWVTEGLARFVEILRINNENIENLCYQVLSNLIRYINANQGGLFLLEERPEEGNILKLTATFAYEKKKHVQKEVEIGEGLVGQCVLEKDYIYMTDVPDEYLNITSGLGHANPRCILIMPLMINGKVYGVLELASFHKLRKFELEFIQKLSENIASTISTVSVNEKTRNLLNHSQQMTEELQAQEEEMRQNMEELEATQEEMNRVYKEMEAQNSIINSVAIVSRTDVKGNITYVNDEFLKWSKYSREELIGKNHRILKSGHQPDEIFREMWRTIANGKTWRGDIKNRAKDGSYYWVDSIIAPVMNEKGKPKEYIAQRFVINDKKAMEEELKNLKLIIEEKSTKTRADEPEIT